VLLLPTATLPNDTPVVLAFSDIVLATPVPESGIDDGDPGALLTSETDPEAVPVPVGPNATVKVVPAPAAIVEGRLRPLMLNPVPDTVACEIVKVALPLF
jgi:hypothetical protein